MHRRQPRPRSWVLGLTTLKNRLYRNLFSAVTSHRHKIDKSVPPVNPKHHIPNPFACLPMLLYKNNLHLVVFGAVTYSVKMTLLASLRSQCPRIYGLTYLQAGLVFVPSGLAGACASKLQGYLIDRHYKKLCRELDGAEFERGEDISDFPIEKARLRGAKIMVAVVVMSTVEYGVVLMTGTVSRGSWYGVRGVAVDENAD